MSKVPKMPKISERAFSRSILCIKRLKPEFKITVSCGVSYDEFISNLVDSFIGAKFRYSDDRIFLNTSDDIRKTSVHP